MPEHANKKSTSVIENDLPNAVTLAALKEVEEMKKHPENYKSYTDVDEMIMDLLNDKRGLK